MALVDDVWDRMEFRTPWSGARERDAVDDALTRFVAWHRSPGARTPSSRPSRRMHRRRSTLPDGQACGCTATPTASSSTTTATSWSSTSRPASTPPTDASRSSEHPQLGLYQLAVDHGAADEAVGQPGAASGGAELVQLRLGGDLPKVQPQAPQVPDADGVTTIERPADGGGARRPRRGVRGPPRRPLRALRRSTRSARPRPPGSVLS